jgi:uncharacterized protein (UPF0332 family)
MVSRIKYLISQGQIARDNSVKALSKKYLQKAKNNLVTMRLLSEINVNKKARDLLNVPGEYNADEWIVVTGYYAMYSGALALLAKIGFRSKNHSATLQVLEEYFVKKKILNSESFLLLKNAVFQKEELEKISEARHKREIAQYSVTKQTTKEIAEDIKEDAYEFVSRVETIVMQ